MVFSGSVLTGVVLQVCSEKRRVEAALDVVKPRRLFCRGNGVQAVEAEANEAVNVGIRREARRDRLRRFHCLIAHSKSTNGYLLRLISLVPQQTLR